jgi:hypothetical protein
MLMNSDRAGRTIAFRHPAAALVLLVASPAATPVWAWGRLGHRVTARLAERHLTPKAKAEIKALLADGESLAACSTWAG